MSEASQHICCGCNQKADFEAGRKSGFDQAKEKAAQICDKWDSAHLAAEEIRALKRPKS